jgi:hypothetical protein
LTYYFVFAIFQKKQQDYLQSLVKGAILRLLSNEPQESLNPAFQNERRGLFFWVKGRNNFDHEYFKKN